MARVKDEAEKTNLTPETFLEGYQRFVSSWNKIEKAKADHRSVVSGIKALGIDMTELKAVHTLRRLDDTSGAEASLKERARYMRWLRMPLGETLSLFGDEEVGAPTGKAWDEFTGWEAEQAGESAGRAGMDRGVDPYPQGTPLSAAWQTGWHRGQEAIAAEMAPKDNADKPKAKPPEGTPRKVVGRRGPGLAIVPKPDPDREAFEAEAVGDDNVRTY